MESTKHCKNCEKLIVPKNKAELNSFRWALKMYCSIKCAREFRRGNKISEATKFVLDRYSETFEKLRKYDEE